MIKREVEIGTSLIARWSTGAPEDAMAEQTVEVSPLPFSVG